MLYHDLVLDGCFAALKREDSQLCISIGNRQEC